MSPFRLYPLIILMGGCLLAIFLYQNNGKIDISRYYLALIQQGDVAKRLYINNEDGVEIVRLSMPTSDIKDYTGQRQLNFHYMDEASFMTLAEAVEKPNLSFSINKRALKKGQVGINRQHKSALSITLPRNKLYVFAPPHLPMAMMALQFEKSNRPDIFSCRGAAAFCQSVGLQRFEGVSQRIEATLEKDRLFDDDPIPRGRWLSKSAKFTFSSTKKQQVTIRYTVKTTLSGQSVALASHNNEQLTVLTEAQPERGRSPKFFALFDYVFDVTFEMPQGDKTLALVFEKATEGSLIVPNDMAGIVTKIEILPPMPNL